MKKYEIPISDEQKESLLTMIKHNLFNYNAKLNSDDDIYDLVYDYTNYDNMFINKSDAYYTYNSSYIISNVYYKCNNKEILIVSYSKGVNIKFEIPDYIFIPNFITKLFYKKRINEFYEYAKNNLNQEYDLNFYEGSYIYAKYNSKTPTYEISVLNFPTKEYYTNIEISEQEYTKIMGGLVASYSREKLVETTELKKIFENSLKIS